MEPSIPKPGIPGAGPVRFPLPDQSDASEQDGVGHLGRHSVRQLDNSYLSSPISENREAGGRMAGDLGQPPGGAKVRKAKQPKTKAKQQAGGAKTDDGARHAPSARVDTRKIVVSLDSLRKTGELLKPAPARQAGLEPAAKSRLEALAREHGELVPLLEKAAAKKLTIAGRGPGDISLHLGPMAYPIDMGSDTAAQLHSLERLMDGYPGGHVVLGWCVGNQMQSKPGLLAESIREHQRVIGDGAGQARLTVHSAALHSQWNPDIVNEHFRGLSVSANPQQDIVSQSKLCDESARRLKDACVYEEQTASVSKQESHLGPQSESAPGAELAVKRKVAQHSAFDALVKEGGGPVIVPDGGTAKEKHIRKASAEIRNIIDRLSISQEPACVDFRNLLSERQELLRKYAGQKVINKQVGPMRKEVQANEEKLLEAADTVFADSAPSTRRRAKLALHSMDVLEQIAIGSLESKVFPKSGSALAMRQKALDETFPRLPQDQVLNPSNRTFCRRIFEAIADEKSLTYMSAQEFEFEEASKQRPILYIYPSDPGPFLTEDARTRVDSLVGQALNLSGEDLASVASELRGKLENPRDSIV